MWPTPLSPAMPAAYPTQGGSWEGQHIPPDPLASPYPSHFSHRAPGGTADCLCLPRGTEGSWAHRATHTPSPLEQGREPSWPVCVLGGGVGGVLRQRCLRGCGSCGEGAPAVLPEAAHFPFGSVISCLGRGEEEAAWVGGPSPERGFRRGGIYWVAALRGSSSSPGAAPLAFSGEDPQRHQGRGLAKGIVGGRRRLLGAPDGILSPPFPQGANLLLTLQGDVKLGQYPGDTIRVRVLWELLES